MRGKERGTVTGVRGHGVGLASRRALVFPLDMFILIEHRTGFEYDC